MDPARGLLWGTVLCGLLDITAACLHASLARGTEPVRLLQGVAGALLGRAAYDGGYATALLGLGLHFGVALSMTALFLALCRAWPELLRRPAVVAPLYGLTVFCLMNFGVLPVLSWTRSLYLHTPVVFPGPMGWPQAVIHVVCVGGPIVFTVRRWMTPR